MKHLIFTLLFFIPVVANAQTKQDFENTMRRFVEFYNRSQTDSICSMYSDVWRDKSVLWSMEKHLKVKKTYGKIKTYKYVLVDTVTDGNKITLFKVNSARKTFMLGMTLDDKTKLQTFRFDTSSPYIDSLLLKY